MITPKQPIFDFSEYSDISQWKVVDDGVMGGLSQGNFELNTFGNAVFSGNVRLENNGGFSSVRYAVGKTIINKATKIVIRLKGDGKTYQFRLKTKQSDYYSYVTDFKTSGEWETIEIPLKSLYPTFRGRDLNMGNFADNSFEEIGLLIGNKKKESFRLELDYIILQ